MKFATDSPAVSQKMIPSLELAIALVGAMNDMLHLMQIRLEPKLAASAESRAS